MAVSSPSGSWIQLATISPRTMAAAMQPNSGRPAAKLAVPSTGSTTKASSAPAMLVEQGGIGRAGLLPHHHAAGEAGEQRRR